MRRTLPALALVAALAACSSDSTTASETAASAATPATTEASATTALAADEASRALRDAFAALPGAAALAPHIDALALDGRAVVARTTLLDGDTDQALTICEAAYSAARAAGADFVSVRVSAMDDSTLASRNELAGDVACST